MSYLLDRKNKKNNFLKIIIIIILFFLIFYFRTHLSKAFSVSINAIFKPVLIFGNNLGNKFSVINSSVKFKKTLINENLNLKNQINENFTLNANYHSILNENIKLKEILDRKIENIPMILGNIISKKSNSIYSSFIIDLGAEQGIYLNKKVFAFGNIPIGKIIEVYDNSAKVILFSSPGEKTEVIIEKENIFMEITGRGGGNFEMILPRDFVLEIGKEIILPGSYPYLIGKVETIISDPRDSFQKALITSPININELKFVQVEK